MKKKIFSTILLVVLIFAMIALTLGLTCIKPNSEREANQIIQTIKKYGSTLSTTQSELMDYINSNASSLIQNYGFTVEEAINYLSDRKAETKLLTLEGINYLKNDLTASAAAKRKKDGVLVTGTGTIADGILTWGEYYSAVKSVNDSMNTSVQGLIDAEALKEKKRLINLASTKDIEKIEFVENTVQKEYLKGDTIDMDKLSIRIVYLEGAAQKTKEIPVTDAMVTTAFDSAAVAKDKKLVVSFTANNNVKNEDGDYEYQAIDLTAEWTYEVKKAPTPRTKVVDEKDDTVIARYGTKEEIAIGYADKELKLTDEYINIYMKDGVPTLLDLDAKINSSASFEKEAFRQLKSQFASAFRTMSYFYNSALENQVLASLQWELQETSLVGKDDAFWNTEVGKQFDYLTSSVAVNYANMTKQEQKDAFVTAIGTALTSLYYIPKVYDENNVENLQDYAWVSQILFSFTDAQKAQLGANPTDAAYANMMLHMTVDEANPAYEPNHEHDKNCATDCNKDTPYLRTGLKVFEDKKNEDGTTTLSVYSQLCLDLDAAVQSGKSVLKVFEDYLYRYNADDGIFNNELGYLITPEGEKHSWVDGFAKLGRDLIKNSKGVDNMPTAGYYYDGAKVSPKTKAIMTADGEKTVPIAAYCYSTYGIHLMMVKFTPFNAIMLDKEAYAFGGGYRFNVKDALTDKNQETEVASKTTFFKTLESSAKTEIKTEAYNVFIEKYITDENKESPDTSIVIDENKLNALIKKYTN